MYYTVDRLVDNMVILEDSNGETQTVSADALPAVTAGDVLRYENGVYAVDVDETAKRRDMAFSLEQKLRQKICK